MNSDSEERFDKKTQLFYDFITWVNSWNKIKDTFNIRELHDFFMKNGYDITEMQLFNYIKKVILRWESVGIIIKNGKKGQLNYTFDFRIMKYKIYIRKFFLSNTSEFEEKFDELFQNHKNRELISLFKQALLEKNKELLFFKTRDFIAENGKELYSRLGHRLHKCIKNDLLWIKWKELFYIKSTQQDNTSDYDYIISNFKISGTIWKNHINDLKTIFMDLEGCIDLKNFTSEDIHIIIESDIRSMIIVLYNRELIKHMEKIAFIADEIWEKKWYIISIRKGGSDI